MVAAVEQTQKDVQVTQQPQRQTTMSTMDVQEAQKAPEAKKSWIPLRLRGGLGPCCAMIDACLCCCALEDICCCGLEEMC